MNQPTPKLPQAQPPSCAPRKPLKPKQQAYLQKLWANRQKAGLGAVYYAKAARKGIPMVFRRYDGEDLVGTIIKDEATHFTLWLQQGRTVVEKLDLQYACKAGSSAASPEGCQSGRGGQESGPKVGPPHPAPLPDPG